MMNENWFEAKVLKIVELTEDIKHFWIQVFDLDSFNFKPGQHITIKFNGVNSSKSQLRSYSIASHPNNKNIFELVIRRIHSENISAYLFNEVQVSTLLKIKGPSGNFILPEIIENDICFVCTGSGITPFRSMIYYLLEEIKTEKKIYLFYGTQFSANVLFRNEMELLQKKHSQFSYQFILSKEESGSTNTSIGYVHQLYENKFQTNQPMDFYLCGWNEMIQEAKARLQKMGVPEKNIHYEKYN